eukprot:GDKI01003698.1.p1 GENE.GDKI01003698.1~~GDKI01003698.1.p1  ORF type:complete len:360 (+),score=68.85 GDKI01003698.1:39-1118(+)
MSLPSLHPIHQNAPSEFGQPIEVAHFSYSQKGGLRFDRSSLKTFRPPPTPYNLNEGFETYAQQQHSDNGAVGESKSSAPLDRILQAHSHHQPATSIYNYDLVTYRNNINKLMLTPFNTHPQYGAWSMGVHRVNNTIFLDVHTHDEGGDAEQQKVFYRGYKFEHICTADDPRTPVDTSDEYCTVVKTRVGDRRLLIGAEIDGWDPAGNSYVELKLVLPPNNPRSNDAFLRDKLLKFFIQSHVAGVPTIVCGERDHSGTLQALRPIKTVKIPCMANERNPPNVRWDHRVSVRFLNSIIDFLFEKMKPNTSGVLRYQPAGDMRRHGDGVSGGGMGGRVENQIRLVMDSNFRFPLGVHAFPSQ